MLTLSTPRLDGKNFLTELFSVSGWLMLLIAVLAGFLNLYLVQEFILTDEVFHNTLGERLAHDRIEKMLDGRNAYNWIGYALIPVGVFLQVLAVSFCLMVGIVFSAAKVSFKRIFKVALVSIGVISVFRLIPVLVLLFRDVQVIDDLLTSDWYSLLGLIGSENAVTWLHVPLAALNIFHLLLVLMLFGGLQQYMKQFPRQAAMLGYVAGTVLWWVCLMYVQVSMG